MEQGEIIEESVFQNACMFSNEHMAFLNDLDAKRKF